MKALSVARPTPSMLISIESSINRFVNSVLVSLGGNGCSWLWGNRIYTHDFHESASPFRIDYVSRPPCLCGLSSVGKESDRSEFLVPFGRKPKTQTRLVPGYSLQRRAFEFANPLSLIQVRGSLCWNSQVGRDHPAYLSQSLDVSMI